MSYDFIRSISSHPVEVSGIVYPLIEIDWNSVPEGLTGEDSFILQKSVIGQGSGIIVEDYIPYSYTPKYHFKMGDNNISNVVVDSVGECIATVPYRTVDMSVIGKVGRALSCVNWSIDTNDCIASNPMTIAFWYNGNDDGFYSGRPIVSSPLESNAYVSIYIGTNKHIGFINGDNTKLSSCVIKNNTTYHIVVIIDSGSWSLYINGSFITTMTGMFSTINHNMICTVGGGRLVEGNYTAGGWIDDFRIYNTALAPEQVAVIYNSGSGTESSSLTAYMIANRLIDPADASFLKHNIIYDSVTERIGDAAYTSSSCNVVNREHLPVPTGIDITSLVGATPLYIVDTDANIDNSLYLYRITGVYDGESFETNYVLSPRSIIIEDAAMEIAEESGISTALGGTIYRTDDSGNLTIKGFPACLPNPRFRGPIEYEKEYAKRDHLYRTFEFFDSILDGIDKDINNIIADLNDSGTALIEEHRSQI